MLLVSRRAAPRRVATNARTFALQGGGAGAGVCWGVFQLDRNSDWPALMACSNTA